MRALIAIVALLMITFVASCAVMVGGAVYISHEAIGMADR